MKESKVVTITLNDDDSSGLDKHLINYTIFGWYVVSTSSKRVKLSNSFRVSNPFGNNKITLADAQWGDEHSVVLNREKNINQFDLLSQYEREYETLLNEKQKLETYGAYNYIDTKDEPMFSLFLTKQIRSFFNIFTLGLSYIFYYRKHPLKSKKDKSEEYNKYKLVADNRIKEIESELLKIAVKVQEIVN